MALLRSISKQVSGRGAADGLMAFGVIKNVRKVFQVDELGSTALEPVLALDDASFNFEQGDLIALLGPSGCGKTTLLRIVGGLIAKSAGSVAIGGGGVTQPGGGERLRFP